MDEHYLSLFSYVRFLSGASVDGEDIVQQAFLLAYERLVAGKPFEGDVSHWLRGTARNLVFSWWRQQKGIPEKIARNLARLAEKADDPDEVETRAELAAAMRQCLGKLAPEDHDLIAKRYEEDRQVTDIAEKLQQNLTTVYVRLHRIRLGLKRCVEAALSGGVPS